VISKNIKLFGDISLDIESLKATLARVESIRPGPYPSLEEAVKTAIHLEINAAEFHTIVAVKSADSGISLLLNNLSAFDSTHFGVLEKFSENRGITFTSKPRPTPATLASLSASDRKISEEPLAISPETLERIEYYFKWHKGMDYYKVLGIQYYATGDQIKHTFRTLAHEFHPDRYPHKQLREKLHEIFSYMSAAYTTLINPDKRRKYDRTLNIRMRNA
jgi:hypothetical protein